MLPLAILATSAFTHFFHFGQPAAVVFDEVRNGFYMTAYWNGAFFFNVHPPLAEMAASFAGYAAGANRLSIDWTAIGNPLPRAATILRLFPAIAGTVLPLIVYGIMRRLQISKIAAFTAAMLVVFENSLLVQSRFILFDIVMLSCGFGSVLAYLEWRRRGKGSAAAAMAFLAVLLAAAAVSIKWTGLAFLGLIIFMDLREHYEGAAGSIADKAASAIKASLPFALPSILAVLIVYFGVFAANFALLPRSGSGDPFMTPSFQKTLAGSPYASDPSVAPEGLVGKFLEMNKRMFTADESLDVYHPYSSKWYTWPLMLRPIYYWEGAGENIYYLGNPFIYWLGAAAIIGLAAYWLILHARRRYGNLPEKIQRAVTFVVAGFSANFLPFIFIGRVMFLYHYEAALVFSIMAVALLLDMIPEWRREAAVVAVMVLSLACFVYFAPLSYGTPMSFKAFEQRMWLQSWR